ncbi:MAG TPA: hypothetical protein VFO41_04080 [Alphaproteobacteria bacterium]|nr:hypothetical protein [Alphaproteobacteria bacterium]
MHENPITFAALFAFWPSSAALAADMEVPANRVRQWKARNSLDPYYWPQFRRKLRIKFWRQMRARYGRLIDYEDLVEASRKRTETRIAVNKRSALARRRKRVTAEAATGEVAA